MTYNLFPAVDENFDFPEEIRVQLAKSEELRHMITPMSEATRDLLTGDELWVGRTIFNTTTNNLESFKDSLVWVTYLDALEYVIEPPLPWDENYEVPVEVRVELAASEQLRNMVVPMTQEDRDVLDFLDKWPGKTIYNLTTEHLETFNSTTALWVQTLDETYVPVPDTWTSWTPLLQYIGSTTTLSNQTAVGRYIIEGLLATVYFKVTFSGDIDYSETEKQLRLSAPVISGTPYTIQQMGTAIFDMAGLGRVSGNILAPNDENYFTFECTKADGYSDVVTNIIPAPWTIGCSIEGQITYEIGV